jgi:hypothetical protein
MERGKLIWQQREYCPPIDTSLVHSFYSDFQGEHNALQQARELLDGLKASAIEQQATDFDPSGSSRETHDAEEWRSQTTETEHTSLSNEVSTLSFGGRSASGSEDSSEGGCFHESEHLDTPTKELLLFETFPTLSFDLVVRTLKKCDNNLSKATDELLNQVYFEDSRSTPTEEVVPKGIDAFAEEHHIPQRSKKGKAKRKQKFMPLYDTPSASASDSDILQPPPTNKWQDSERDIDFIASKTNIARGVIASLYHNNGISKASTIMALVDQDIEKHRDGKEPDASTTAYAIRLVEAFQHVDLEDAVALIRLTAPSTANAHELAEVLLTQPSTAARMNGGIEVIPRYAPIDLSDPTPETKSSLPSLPSSANSHSTETLSAARSAAFAQASAAYRKGKSTPLMKAAAGYYSQIGRDLNTNLKAMNESEADALVASQSSPTCLDLHGVSVLSATRIAKEQTQKWWDGLGEARIPGGGRAGVGSGYTIVTGLGRHSEGGRGKIGPAVVRALVKEGWKIEVGNGELTVNGKARRR